MSTESPTQALLSSLALSGFRLNGQFLALAEDLARPAGLTAAWWQVLGAVLREPLTVPAIAREMGLTRQSVQRIADLLVDRGLADWQPNPSHRRSRLLRVTDRGLAAVQAIDPQHAAAAARLVAFLGRERSEQIRDALTELIDAMDQLDAASSQANSAQANSAQESGH